MFVSIYKAYIGDGVVERSRWIINGTRLIDIPDERDNIIVSGPMARWPRHQINTVCRVVTFVKRILNRQFGKFSAADCADFIIAKLYDLLDVPAQEHMYNYYAYCRTIEGRPLAAEMRSLLHRAAYHIAIGTPLSTILDESGLPVGDADRAGIACLLVNFVYAHEIDYECSWPEFTTNVPVQMCALDAAPMIEYVHHIIDHCSYDSMISAMVVMSGIKILPVHVRLMYFRHGVLPIRIALLLGIVEDRDDAMCIVQEGVKAMLARLYSTLVTGLLHVMGVDVSNMQAVVAVINSTAFGMAVVAGAAGMRGYERVVHAMLAAKYGHKRYAICSIINRIIVEGIETVHRRLLKVPKNTGLVRAASMLDDA